MIQYKERSFSTASRSCPVLVIRNFPNQNWNPPLAASVVIPYKVPEFIRLSERLWWDDGIEWQTNFYKSRSSWKPCQHYKCWLADPVDQSPVQYIAWATTSVTDIGSYVDRIGAADRLLAADHSTFRSSFGAFGSHNLGIPSMTVENLDKSFVPPPDGLSTLVKRSLDRMLPNVKAELSLINTIIELKDFSSLPNTIRKLSRYAEDIPVIFKNLKAINSALHGKPPTYFKKPSRALAASISKRLKAVRKSFTGLQGRTLAELLHAPADGFLQVEFNILPLLTDMCGIYLSLSKLEKTMRSLINQQGRHLSKHYTWTWIPSQFAGASTTLNYTLNLGQFAGYTNPPGFTGCTNGYRRSIRMTREVMIDQPAVFHAEIEYSYSLSSFQNEHARLLTLLDYLGVNLNPMIIWNAIPWSFVVDWFIGVNRWLDGRKILNMEPVVAISRYLWSVKTKRRIRTSFDTSTNDPLSPPLNRTWLPDLYEETYRRDVRLPTATDSFFGSSLSSTELTLGGALVFARRRRQNTRMRG